MSPEKVLLENVFTDYFRAKAPDSGSDLFFTLITLHTAQMVVGRKRWGGPLDGWGGGGAGGVQAWKCVKKRSKAVMVFKSVVTQMCLF